jgi:hypothetical protein
MPKKTPAQRFHDIFRNWTSGANEHVRGEAEKKMDAWLAKNNKTRADISSIVADAVADDLKANPPPPPSDPRDAAPHPFEDPAFTPAGLVEGIIKKYVTMGEHECVIYTLWVIFTHVYRQFTIAPRIALTSEEENSGKTVLVEIARRLALRPNADSISTGVAIIDHIDVGPGTVCADEIDLYDAEAQRWLRLIWNLGHWHLARRALMVKGKRKLVNLHAPVIAAGIGDVFKRTQMSRAYVIEMRRYTEKTMPERDFFANEGVEDLDTVYSYLHNWATAAKLNPKPAMPVGVITRFADNARGLISVADCCGPEWGRRGRAAVMYFMTKDKAERPQLTMVRHGLVIFEALEVDHIRATHFNRELKRLDLPDARWTRYCGPSGIDYAHPIEMHEQAALGLKVGIQSVRIRPPGGKQYRGYKLEQFEEAQRKYGVAVPDETEVGRARLRLVKPPSD